MKAKTIFVHPRLTVLLGLLVFLAAATWLFDRHYFGVRWPNNIQQEVLGSTVATAGSLLSKERSFSQFAEGFARWRYKADASNAALKRLCKGTDVRKCSFTKTRSSTERISLSVSLSNGILTVEEWWS